MSIAGNRLAGELAHRVVALIMAAGRGSRAASPGDAGAKQYAQAGGRTMLGHTLAAFLRHRRIDAVMAVIASGDEAAYRATVSALDGSDSARLLGPAVGGATRQISVAAGLEALAPMAPARVLIHDAARPFVSGATIEAVIEALDGADAALPVLAIADTLKRIEGARIVATEDRARFAAAQTPQGFRFAAILSAHRRAASEGRSDFTDDAAVAEWAGLAVTAVPGDPDNAKITGAADLAAARARLERPRRHGGTRVGSGFDVHAFGPGNSLRLCGVEIAHERGLKGHSDADVALHALTDALYGAVGAADIGHHFPPSDARWKGVDSSHFLAHARAQVERAGAHIVHVDVTIICERPKIGPHRAAMVARLAGLLGLPQDAVSVKATTTERLGFTGRGEGIAAQAVATVVLEEQSP